MSVSYKIVVKNETGQQDPKNYAFFTKPPIVSRDPTSKNVYTNVWQSLYLADRGQGTLQATNEYYAYCGKAPRTLAPGVVITQGQGQKVDKIAKSATDPGTSMTLNIYADPNGIKYPRFGTVGLDCTTPSCFGMTTPDAFAASDNIIFGMCQPGDLGYIPTATFAAQSNYDYTIQPIVQFYVAESSQKVGEAFLFSASNLRMAEIDFTKNPGNFAALVTQDSTNNYSVKYFQGTAAMEQYLGGGFHPPSPSPSLGVADILRETARIFDLIESLRYIHVPWNYANSFGHNRDPHALVNPTAFLVRAIGFKSNSLATAGFGIVLGVMLSKYGFSVKVGTKTEKSPDGETWNAWAEIIPAPRPVRIAAEPPLEEVRAQWADAMLSCPSDDGGQDGGVVKVPGENAWELGASGTKLLPPVPQMNGVFA